MKGYWLILKADVVDQHAQEQYGRLWKPIAERYGARLDPLDVPPLLKEARDTRRVIVVEFPSYEAARSCYDDPAYQEARRSALKASGRELLIFGGDLG